jgi:hypothetical protein
MLFLIILILSYVGSLFLPWWIVAVAAFLAALFVGKKSGSAFLSGFAAVFVLWVVWALVKSIPNDNILASRVVQLFPLPNYWIWVLIVTGFVGGLVGGMGALSGVMVKKVFAKPGRNRR